MLINLSELFSVEGKARTYICDLEMDCFHGPDGDYEILRKSPITLEIKNQGDRVFGLKGEGDVVLQMPCGRCLEPVEVPIHVEIDDEIDMKQTEEERAKALNEQFYVSGYNLDVDRLVGNELTLNLPMKVLCREDCKGICNRCGTNLNYGTCDCDTRSLDPRMSVIQDIFKQLKEV